VLLALDVGNTNVTIGTFEGGKLTAHWRLSTVHEQTADEWGILFRNLFALDGLDIAAIDGIVIASVVPPLDTALDQMAQHYFHTEAMFISSQTDLGLKLCQENPEEVGADRLVNAFAAYAKYGGPCVVVDLGTAITFDVISAKREYLGGLITAGITISIEALFSKTARLPMVEFRPPAKLIGTGTVSAMRSGLYYGALGMIDGIIERLVAHLGPETKCIATGGQARLISAGSRYLKQIDEDLTLDGLQMIWERTRRQ
jgi:type III pantothenate kinase